MSCLNMSFEIEVAIVSFLYTPS